MSDAEKNEKARQGKSAAALEALGEGTSDSSSPPAKPVKKKKKKVVEKKGVGDSTQQRRENTARIVTGIRKDFERAMSKGNIDKADELRNRIKAVIAAGE